MKIKQLSLKKIITKAKKRIKADKNFAKKLSSYLEDL